jgi:probable HAF family extracellular repeat protein
MGASSIATGAAFAQQYQFTNVDALAQSYIGGATASSRSLSLNQSGELVGDYQAAGTGTTRQYFTLAAGATSITPYATVSSNQLNYFAAALPLVSPPGGGQMINDSGVYLAQSTAGNPPGIPTGSYSPTSTQFTTIPFPSNAYNGTYLNPITGQNQTQSNATENPLPYAINDSGVIVGTENYVVTNTTPNIGSFNHGFIYNPGAQTTTDLGGAFAGGNINTGNTQLVGISNNNYVVGAGSIATATFRETTTDAVLGTPGSGGNYTFTDLASLISPLATAAGGGYQTSAATNISPNGQYIIGIYTEKNGTKTYTRSFEINEGGSSPTAVDLGVFSPTTSSTSLLNADAVDDNGDVVGSGASGTVTHAFLYSNGTLTDLNSLAPASGFIYNYAFTIDDNRDIAGYGNNTANGGVATSAFLLTAVPEPATTSLLAVGAVALLRRRRR